MGVVDLPFHKLANLMNPQNFKLPVMKNDAQIATIDVSFSVRPVPEVRFCLGNSTWIIELSDG